MNLEEYLLMELLSVETWQVLLRNAAGGEGAGCEESLGAAGIYTLVPASVK